MKCKYFHVFFNLVWARESSAIARQNTNIKTIFKQIEHAIIKILKKLHKKNAQKICHCASHITPLQAYSHAGYRSFPQEFAGGL